MKPKIVKYKVPYRSRIKANNSKSFINTTNDTTKSTSNKCYMASKATHGHKVSAFDKKRSMVVNDAQNL